MNSKCLRLVRICEVLFAQLCKGVYQYRTSAGCCSIITVWAYQSL